MRKWTPKKQAHNTGNIIIIGLLMVFTFCFVCIQTVKGQLVMLRELSRKNGKPYVIRPGFDPEFGFGLCTQKLGNRYSFSISEVGETFKERLVTYDENTEIDILPEESHYPEQMVSFKSNDYFIASTKNWQPEVFKTDGTTSGTSKLNLETNFLKGAHLLDVQVNEELWFLKKQPKGWGLFLYSPIKGLKQAYTFNDSTKMPLIFAKAWPDRVVFETKEELEGQHIHRYLTFYASTIASAFEIDSIPKSVIIKHVGTALDFLNIHKPSRIDEYFYFFKHPIGTSQELYRAHVDSLIPRLFHKPEGTVWTFLCGNYERCEFRNVEAGMIFLICHPDSTSEYLLTSGMNSPKFLRTLALPFKLDSRFDPIPCNGEYLFKFKNRKFGVSLFTTKKGIDSLVFIAQLSKKFIPYTELLSYPVGAQLLLEFFIPGKKVQYWYTNGTTQGTGLASKKRFKKPGEFHQTIGNKHYYIYENRKRRYEMYCFQKQ